MTSHVSLLTRINHLLEQIDKVKIFQSHMTLITNSLIRLQYDLNEPNVLEIVRYLQEDIERTLIVIDKVVVSCSEKAFILNGVAYRDLESLLLRFQIRLAQYRADLTDDYQAKVQILSNAYHEQRSFVKKVFDDKIKQRLESLEQETKEKTIENLRLLRERHFDIIKLYLHTCTQLHKSVPLTGLTTDVVIKVAQTFYQISSKDRIQLEHTWQSSDLPLIRTFIQFKHDKSTSFERNEARRLLIEPETNILQGPHTRKTTTKGIWERLVSAPYMMSMIERDRYTQEQQDEDNVSEENIIRTKRWIVILGDPGSGKTSFARWLVRHLAQTLLLSDQHSTDYGPLRIPILIRIGEFAEMLKQKPSLTLFDYIGKHKWMGKSIIDDSSISLDNLSCALQDYIKYGHAMIILDGLDEIPVSDQRSLIINAVENFVDTYVQTPSGTSAFDNAYLSRLLDDPCRSGGNQLVVTSRIVGYHAAPLAGQFSHYTIRPMDMEHMKDFVDYWFFRVHQQIIDTLNLSEHNQGEKHGQALKNELEKQDNNGLLDVASNSCLLSFICSVAFSQLDGSPLPTQRIHLYEAIVNSMLTLWSSKRSTIPIAKLIRILSDIASYIHGNSASGLIHEEKMKEICAQSIKASIKKIVLTEEDIQMIENEACEFVRIIREDVGILAARGESLYGFLHLTFQEYFTCLKLIDIDNSKRNMIPHELCLENRLQLIAQSLRSRTNDPRFRVPIALALGKISLSWSQKEFSNFCMKFIQEHDESKSLIPLGAYILLSCSNDFVPYPSNDVLFDTLNRLMIAAGQHKWSVVCPFLFNHIINALRKLRHDIVSLWIENFLSSSHDIQTISALCHLLEGKPHEFGNIKWLNQSSCSMLQHLSSLDNEMNEFVIDRLLVKIAFSNHRLLPINSNTFKEFLITEEIELNTIPVDLFPLIISLYGGLKRSGVTVVFDPFYIYRESIAVTPILVHFLSKNHQHQQDETLMSIKEECLRLLLIRIQNSEESPEMVDLCIAIICLYGIDYLREKNELIPDALLQISLNRLKYVSMMLRQFYFTNNEDDQSIENETRKMISLAIYKFQVGESTNVHFLDLLNSLKSGVARLRSSTTSIFLEGESKPNKRVTLYLPNSLRKEHQLLDDLLPADMRFSSNQNSCSLLHHFTKLFWILEHDDDFDTLYRMAVAMDEIPEYLVFRNDEDILSSLAFIPSHLQALYLRLLTEKFIIIHSNEMSGHDNHHHHHLYFSHILTECLILLSNASCKTISTLPVLLALLPMLRIHRLESFGSSLLWTIAIKDIDLLPVFERTKQRPMDFRTGHYMDIDENIFGGDDMIDEKRRALINEYIEQEYQRLQNVFTENDADQMKLYSACVSLACICRWNDGERRLYLINESVQGAMLITNKLARLDALCVIAFYSHSDYDRLRVNKDRSMQQEIEYQFNDIYPTLPVLLHTAIFIRCLSLLQQQQTIDKCLQNLFNKLNDSDQKEQQVVYEALIPYLQSMFAFSSNKKQILNSYLNYHKTINKKSSVFMEYLTNKTDENLSTSLLISNLYIIQLASDLQKRNVDNDIHLLISNYNSSSTDNIIVSSLFQFEGPILTTAHIFIINNILLTISSMQQSKQSEKLSTVLNNTLNHFNSVEFKACRLLESWMKWKDSNELSLFAYHAALLLANSNLWSITTADIICDLLCCENDRFRQRAEMILRFDNDGDIRTSSKLGLDVLLTLVKNKTYYKLTSPSASLTLLRTFENTVLDLSSHLEALLWLERYRIHALANKEYLFTNGKSSPISHIASYFPNDITIEISFCNNIREISNDLATYMCNLIKSNFSSFLAIDDNTTSNAVLESHNQFVISVLVRLGALLGDIGKTNPLINDALMTLLETSENVEIQQATAYAFGYFFEKKTSKILFDKLQMIANNEANESIKYSDSVLSALISSYCHGVSVSGGNFDQKTKDLFRKLLKHSSQDVVKAVHVGLGRVSKETSLLLEMLDSDYIQCYHALVESTAYVRVYNAEVEAVDVAAQFLEEHPDLLPIFVVELYNSIRHFTTDVDYYATIDYYLAYAYPQYVEVASSVAIRMPSAFCSFIKDWQNGDNLKRALFYTSKQHNYPQRAACLTILSIFGELTVELCEMIIEALRDDPHVQNTCYRCLTRIHSIKDEKIVLNLLFSYLKSKSMNVRYTTVKILLHLSRSSLLSSDQVQTVLNDLMLDPDSTEDLWLIEDQDDVRAECVYYYAGPLKDVIYSLLVQHLTGDASRIIRRNEFNDIDMDFIKSERAARYASCLYEKQTEENLEFAIPTVTKSVD